MTRKLPCPKSLGAREASAGLSKAVREATELARCKDLGWQLFARMRLQSLIYSSSIPGKNEEGLLHPPTAATLWRIDLVH